MNQPDLFGLIQDSIQVETDKMCAEAGMLTLGELAARLDAAPQDILVEFSNGMYPGILGSYRGYYNYIAIEYGELCYVKELLKRVKEAIGNTFTGYKGGEYKMTRMTPVWVSDYGAVSGKGIVGVSQNDSKIILHIKQIED